MFNRKHPQARVVYMAAGGLIAALGLAGPAAAAVNPSVTAATITESSTPNLEPLNIAVLPDGTPYFTASTEGSVPSGQLRIGEITPAGPVATYSTGLLQPAQSGQSQLGGITVGPDGNLWFTQEGGTTSQGEGVVYRMTPAGSLSHQRGGGVLSDPSSITSGPGDNLWFTENGDEVGSLGIHGGVGVPISTGNGSENIPGTIVEGPDGNLWVTEANTGQITRVTPQGVVTQFQVTDPGTEPGPTYITVGPDKNLWYVAGDSIGRISTTGGDRADFSVAGLGFNGFPHQIVAGPDGNLWFTVSGAPQLGKMTVNGVATVVSQGITGDTDGIAANSTKVWFTEPASERVGEVSF